LKWEGKKMKKITSLMAMLAVAAALAAPVMAADRDDYGRGREEVRRSVTYNYGYQTHREMRGRHEVRRNYDGRR
jgi:hypothetical protein